MRIELTKFHFYQILGFVISICITVLLIVALGKEEYGQYSYYFAFADLLVASILLGYDQSINLIKDLKIVTKAEKASLIFSSKIIIYLLLIPIPFFLIGTDWQLILFLLLIMSISLFDLSYFYMIDQDLNGFALNYLISKIIFLLVVLILSVFTKNYQFYLFAFALTFGIYVLLGILKSNVNKKFYLNIHLLRGINQVKLALPFGLSRIFIFIELFIVLTLFKNLLSSKNFGIFMISYGIAKIISGGISIFITPVYNKTTLSVISLKAGISELLIIGIFYFSIIFSLYYSFDFSFFSTILNMQYHELNEIIYISLIYGMVLYISSIFYNIVVLAKNKPKSYYLFRLLFIILLYTTMNNYHFSNPFTYIICVEIFILILAIIFFTFTSHRKVAAI